MRTQKTMTPKAIASNQKNAQQSTGPKNVGAVADNAVKHGLLSRNLRFRNAEDEEKFHRLLAVLTRDYAPIGALEEVLVEEMAICWSRSELANAWLTENFVNRGDAASSIIGALAGRSDEGKIPLFPPRHDATSIAWPGFECSELLVRSGTAQSNQEEPGFTDGSGTVGTLVVDAKLVSSAETVLRYQAGFKRDFYKALNALRELRRK
jgi:hypothetical protein